MGVFVNDLVCAGFNAFMRVCVFCRACLFTCACMCAGLTMHAIIFRAVRLCCMFRIPFHPVLKQKMPENGSGFFLGVLSFFNLLELIVENAK